MSGFRVGLGFDLHKITKRKKILVLGGYKINCGFGLEAVSDGDVLLHAVTDAICGAAGLGDIGDYFRPEAKKSKNINSKKIAAYVLNKISGKYRLVNIDITLVAERPKLFAHKKSIVSALGRVFKEVDINLKVKSKEQTQALGGVDTISCLAVALLSKR